jgi:hypothetical protein
MKKLFFTFLITCLGMLISCSKDNGTGNDDTIPPSAPEGLFGLIADMEGTSLDMLLMWVQGNEDDLDGYNVYKKVGDNEFQKINTILVSYDEEMGCLFVDNNFDEVSLHNHSYYVVAVDLSGNESSQSNTVSCVPAQISISNSIENLSPANEIDNVSTTPEFSWSETENALNYCIMLQKGGAGSENPMVWIFRKSVSDTTYLFNETSGYTYLPYEGNQLLNDTYYRWQIFAVDSNNICFAWNEAYFTTKN